MDNLMEIRAEGFEGQRLYRLPSKALARVRKRPFSRDFIVTDLGFFPTVEAHGVTRPAGARQWILIFVHEGRGWYQTGTDIRTLETNQVLLIPPGRFHAYGADRSRPWSIFWLHFEGKGAEHLLDWIIDAPETQALPCRSPDALRRQFHSILATVELGYHDHTLLEISRCLIHVLTLLHRNPASETREHPMDRIEAAMDTMRREIDRPRPLREYAADSGLSVSQFSYLFRQHTGISPMNYLAEIRIQRACEYLDTTKQSIQRIAWELGYDDPLYFSRAFKRGTGLSPLQYRKRL